MKEIIENLIFPNPALIFGIAILAIVDLSTGVLKSKRKGVATASQGFDKTITKAISYLSLITLSFVVTNIASAVYDLSEFISTLNLGLNSVCVFMIYRELKSILENLIIANTEEDGTRNDFAKFLIPIHNALILKFNKEFNYDETRREILKKIKK